VSLRASHMIVDFRFGLPLALICACAIASAQDQGKEPQTVLPPVTATAMRDPVEKS